MSQLLVSNYQREISGLVQYGGSAGEGSIRKAFSNLLDAYCRPHDLRLIDELEYVTKTGANVYPDGTIKDALRLTHGYWEAKDEDDVLDVEIAKKISKGYPTDNILFEDSITAVLIQNGIEVTRCGMRDDPHALDGLITAFVTFERPEVSDFRRAIDKFKDDMPKVLNALREMIDEQLIQNTRFAAALNTFLELCKNSINKSVTHEDVREMLIQHILTEDIFLRIFEDSQFHRENNVARELQRVADTFFTGAVKKNLLRGLESYYGAIRKAAAGIADHHEKQKFLKAIYQDFYKVYNPKLADRLGVVYTPSEIVRFMINGSETLLHRNFNHLLASRNVEILDPAVGTGTFITDIVEHLKGNKQTLRNKYLNEIHCNEVAILPYYIANLNIEFTYAQLVGEYAEFPHICFVDTLDNLGFAKTYTNQQHGLDFGMTKENTERIEKQNKRKISVIIGNPPYNANQVNENDNNKNRVYDGIDKRIKDTWIADSSAQKTKMYDMYARFFRWAADRINSDGIIAFITNRSFIDSRTFDGFRAGMAKEFNEIHIVDLGGDIRANPKLSGTTHNVFGIQTGVAISFWVKRHKRKGCKIYYTRRPEAETASDKLVWLGETAFDQVPFEPVTPDNKHNWINLSDNDFESLLPLVSKQTKASRTSSKERSLFKLFSNGINTARDLWVYDDSEQMLIRKMRFFIEQFESSKKTREFDSTIKWSRNLKRRLLQGRSEALDRRLARNSLYRPYCNKWLYDSELYIDEGGAKSNIFPLGAQNTAICLLTGGRQQFSVIATNMLPNFNLYSADSTQYVPLNRYDDHGNAVDNITDWGMRQFQRRYGDKAHLTRAAIFNYVYAVLHDPIYRASYAVNLRREFPQIPFYKDFLQWSTWGEALLSLHVGYQTVTPFTFDRTDNADITNPKAKLRADKELGQILLDEATTLSGIPATAWGYKLGNRSALEWVLDQYGESKPRDATIREHFDSYRFVDYKETVVSLLGRVCTISIATQKIVAEMETVIR